MIKASRMYRMPENNQEVKRFWAALEVFFFSVCKSPTQSLTFRRTEISWLFLPLFNLFRFILYYFVQAEFFHANLRFQKEKKNFEETLCLQPRQFGRNTRNSRLLCFTYTYMQITVHPPDFAGDKNVDFEFPDDCLFGHPFYFGYHDFIS